DLGVVGRDAHARRAAASLANPDRQAVRPAAAPAEGARAPHCGTQSRSLLSRALASGARGAPAAAFRVARRIVRRGRNRLVLADRAAAPDRANRGPGALGPSARRRAWSAARERALHLARDRRRRARGADAASQLHVPPAAQRDARRADPAGQKPLRADPDPPRRRALAAAEAEGKP